MNSVRMQYTKSIHKGLLLLYILETNDEKEILRQQSHLQLHEKYKIPRNRFNWGGKEPGHWKL